MSRKLWGLAVVLLAVVCVAGCGANSSGTGSGSDNASTNAGATPGAPSGGGTGGGGGQLPDACTLITAGRLSQLLGIQVGTGTSAGVSADRSVCIYGGGTITGVEVASHYDTTRVLIEDDGGRKTTDIPGLGKRAFFDEAGQVVASGDRVFVVVTASGVSQDKLIAAARELLVAAGETP